MDLDFPKGLFVALQDLALIAALSATNNLSLSVSDSSKVFSPPERM